jgi:hypothetical protein
MGFFGISTLFRAALQEEIDNRRSKQKERGNKYSFHKRSDLYCGKNMGQEKRAFFQDFLKRKGTFIG